MNRKVKLILIFLLMLLISLNIFFLKTKIYQKEESIKLTENIISDNIYNEKITNDENIKQPQEILITTTAAPNPTIVEKSISINGWIPNFDFYNGFESVSQNLDSISEIHYAGASLDGNGEVNLSEDSGNKLANLNNLNKDFGLNIYSNDQNAVLNLINNIQRRNSLSNKVIELKQQHTNLKTLNLNFENINSSDYPKYTEFLSELKSVLNSNQINLYITFFPNPDNLSNIQKLIDSTDQIIIMTYDYVLKSDKRIGSEMSNAPDFWIEEILKSYSANINKDKLAIALPLYGYGFDKSTGAMTTSYTYSQIQGLIQSNNLLPSLDTSSNEEYIEIGNEIIYFQIDRTLVRKKELIKGYGISKIFYWRFGGDEGIGF